MFFENCRINFGRDVKIAFRVPIRNIFKKNTVSEKESFSSQFCKSSEEVFAFCWSFLARGCQNCLLRVHWNVLSDLILSTYFVSFLIPAELKSSCILWKIFRQNCQNCIPSVHGEKLGWIFSKQIYCFSSFLEIEQKNFGLLTSFFRQIFENYILRVHKSNLRTFFAKKTNIHQFWNLKEKNYAFFPKSNGGVVKTAFYLSTGTFRGVFLGKSTFLSLWDVVGELSDLFRKSLGGVVKFCNYVSRETFRGKKIFFPEERYFSKQAELERKFFGNCRKIFGRPAKTAFRVPIRNVFKKTTVSEKESFSSQFRKSSEKVFAFCWSFSGWGCQNCLLRVHWNVLRDLILPNYFLSFSVADTGLKSSCILWIIYRQNCQNCIPSVHGEVLG